MHLKQLLLSVQRGGKCYHVGFSDCIARGEVGEWRCNQRVLVQEMKLFCLTYHRNSRVKLQAKLSFLLLLLPSLITWVGLTWVFYSHLHPCQENSTKSAFVYFHSLNSTHSFFHLKSVHKLSPNCWEGTQNRDKESCADSLHLPSSASIVNKTGCHTSWHQRMEQDQIRI